MDSYQKAIDMFYEIYRPIQRKYNLRCHICTSLYADALIEVWEYHGEVKGKCICKVKEKESTECYERATEHLKQYAKRRETQLTEKSVAVAV